MLVVADDDEALCWANSWPGLSASNDEWRLARRSMGISRIRRSSISQHESQNPPPYRNLQVSESLQMTPNQAPPAEGWIACRVDASNGQRWTYLDLRSPTIS